MINFPSLPRDYILLRVTWKSTLLKALGKSNYARSNILADFWHAYYIIKVSDKLTYTRPAWQDESPAVQIKQIFLVYHSIPDNFLLDFNEI